MDAKTNRAIGRLFRMWEDCQRVFVRNGAGVCIFAGVACASMSHGSGKPFPTCKMGGFKTGARWDNAA